MKTLKYLAIITLLLAGTIGVRLTHGHRDHHIIFLKTRITEKSAFGNMPAFSAISETPAGISNDIDDDTLDDDLLEDFCKLLFVTTAFTLFASALKSIDGKVIFRPVPLAVYDSRIVKLRRFRI